MMFFSRNNLVGALSLFLIAGPASAQDTALGMPTAQPLENEPITVEPGQALRDSPPETEVIAGTEIGTATSEAAGLVGSQTTGLPETMWQGTTGAAAIAAVDSAHPSDLWRVNALIRRALSWRILYEVLLESAVTTAMLFTVLIGALLFANFINFTDFPQRLLAIAAQFSGTPWMVIVAILGLAAAGGAAFARRRR